MNFRIADTFTDSLGRLTGDEQKAAKTTAFDLQMNPAMPGLQFHRIDKSKDKNFWSVRVNADVRIIVHKTTDSLLLCYVDHHDRAYSWAERRKLETHPKTGAAQFVEIRERVEEIIRPVYVDQQQIKEKPLLFTKYSDEELLNFGVPQEWLGDVKLADEESLLLLADHLPAEAAEALLEIATGGKPQVRKTPPIFGITPFEHPDALRRFRIMTNVEELERALNDPWEKWTVFLHPYQREWVERDYTRPARVSGSAGTGKTIVAVHRAAHLARKFPDSRVLLVTFSETLAHALRLKLRRLIGKEPGLAERIDVHSIDAIGLRLYKAHFGPVQIITREQIMDILQKVSNPIDTKVSRHFLFAEWDQIVDTWQITSWEEYRDVQRLGRKTRLPEQRRAELWKIFEQVLTELSQRKLMTMSRIFHQLASKFSGTQNPPFDFAVVDEAQDINVAQLRFLAAIGGDRSNSLFFAGDLGQRIFQQPFSWKSIGVDIRGRSRTLRVNYRTSHQIRRQADLLLGPEVADVDGNVENRSETISVFNGPLPEIRTFNDSSEEVEAVSKWLLQQISSHLLPHEIAVFVRSPLELDRAKSAIEKAQIPFKVLDERVEVTSGNISLCTMHLAKGLEFRAVAVMACDDEVIPSQQRIESVGDDADLQEVYDTERQLLYVACTRARDHLLVTSGGPASEFIDDLRSQ